MLRYGTMSTNGNGDAIIAMPCGKWCPRFRKDFAHEMLHLRMRKVKRTEFATGDGTLFSLAASLSKPPAHGKV